MVDETVLEPEDDEREDGDPIGTDEEVPDDAPVDETTEEGLEEDEDKEEPGA